MSVFGHHSVGELRDWLRANDYAVSQVQAAFEAFAPTWKAKDESAFEAWNTDWTAFRKRYGAAHDKARMAIGKAMLSPVPDDLMPVEDEWQGVHLALVQAPRGPISKGDLQDLYVRLGAARGAPIDVSKTPQPTAVDADIEVFRAADAVKRAGDDLGKELPQPDTSTKFLLGGAIALGLFLAARSVFR